jgi:tetratricopeptide (TPR) repeat protein
MPAEKDQLSSPTLAELYYKQGDRKKAIEVLRQALKNQPGNMDARRKLQEWEKQLEKDLDKEERKKRLDKLKRILDVIRKERATK